MIASNTGFPRKWSRSLKCWSKTSQFLFKKQLSYRWSKLSFQTLTRLTKRWILLMENLRNVLTRSRNLSLSRLGCLRNWSASLQRFRQPRHWSRAHLLHQRDWLWSLRTPKRSYLISKWCAPKRPSSGRLPLTTFRRKWMNFRKKKRPKTKVINHSLVFLELVINSSRTLPRSKD